MNYKIFGANIKYPGPYKFLKGRANKYKDIGDEEMGNMKKILDVAIEHGCPEVNGQRIVSGPSKVLHLDLMRSLHDNGLVVTGGQVFLYSSSSDYSNLTGNLELFVTENLAAGAG